MKNNICPKCEDKDIKKGVMGGTVGQVYMYSDKNLRSKPSPISVEYCSSCGHILSFYVDKPENLG